MQEPSIRRVAFASFIGTAIEWYDFFLYGTASALVFRKLFFGVQPINGDAGVFRVIRCRLCRPTRRRNYLRPLRR